MRLRRGAAGQGLVSNLQDIHRELPVAFLVCRAEYTPAVGLMTAVENDENDPIALKRLLSDFRQQFFTIL